MVGNFMDLLTKKAPEFPEDYTWLNTKERLSLERLKGHVVILDFWTYCCINCMHMLPVLSRIEEHYKDRPVVVIGVHSAKFKNEAIPENIEQAIERYGIRHPVIVDENHHIWNSYFVSAWPTTVIISPSSRIAYKLAGEYSYEQLVQLIDYVLKDSEKDGTLAKKKISIHMKSTTARRRTLSFPAKMSFREDGKRFALSDSNNNRILLIDAKTGRMLEQIGGPPGGFIDGGFKKARFSRPQGVLWSGNSVYVADTENHSVREINLSRKTVTTIAGTGQKGKYVDHGKEFDARSVQLNSPWDLAIDSGTLYIAMAGFHQIWTYDTKRKKAKIFAGVGREDIVDGLLESAEFAQPSGLWIDSGTLYVADSEASAVRSVSFKSKYVSTIIGEGLFSFGDKSGSLTSAELQHPIGICELDGTLYVADTYNSTIRAINLKDGKVSNIVGNKQNKSVCRFDDPDCDTLGLYEPNDVKTDGSDLYIVDTNNHLVRKFEMKSKILKTVNIK